jgi:hypothetical protein
MKFSSSLSSNLPAIEQSPFTKGYTGKRPGLYKIEPLTNCTPMSCVEDLCNFASNLKRYGDMNSYHDIGNLADSLSGEAAKTKYLLTLS